jgi:hypothetical protein
LTGFDIWKWSAGPTCAARPACMCPERHAGTRLCARAGVHGPPLMLMYAALGASKEEVRATNSLVGLVQDQARPRAGHRGPRTFPAGIALHTPAVGSPAAARAARLSGRPAGGPPRGHGPAAHATMGRSCQPRVGAPRQKRGAPACTRLAGQPCAAPTLASCDSFAVGGLLAGGPAAPRGGAAVRRRSGVGRAGPAVGPRGAARHASAPLSRRHDGAAARGKTGPARRAESGRDLAATRHRGRVTNV